jgi:DNA-binding transcriptional LysR family regulator
MIWGCSMLDFRRLRLLHELKLRGTIAAVARALSYSPSAVSQQLSLLEREVGVALLEPVGRRVQLTRQGEVLAEHARWLLARLEQAEADVERSLDEIAGVVRIAVFQSAAHAFIPQTLTLLARKHPAIQVEVTEREPEQGLFDVAARDFDLVVAEQYPGVTRPHREGLDRVHLAADPIRLAVAPDSTDIASLSDAREQPWVLEPEGTAARQWAVQCCRAAGFEPAVRFETADLMAHIRLIRSGNAVGLLPDLLWAGAAPSVRMLDLASHPKREIFTSTRESTRERPAVVACRQALALSVAELQRA